MKFKKDRSLNILHMKHHFLRLIRLFRQINFQTILKIFLMIFSTGLLSVSLVENLSV